ncbi:MAG: DsbA family protein [Deltaproteobacteria bacterium]|nr:DsbA family protein [Deltaproteobacteria bacterium]
MKLLPGLGILLSLAACGPAGAPDTTAIRAKLSADEQLDLARFTPEESETLARILLRAATPCDGVRTVAEELLDPASTCTRAQGAARFAARRLIDGYSADEIETQLLQRYRETEPLTIDLDDSPVLGPPDAPLTIVIFSDFECPICAAAAERLHAVRERSPERVRIVFKHFPIDQLHAMAMSAARAAIAAGNQGKFWEFHDALFADQESIGPGLYVRIATALGLDLDRFEAERISEASADRVRSDRAEGVRLGVEGTPAIFVNGRRFQDSVQYLEEWIEEE